MGIDQLRGSKEPVEGTFLGLVLLFVSWETLCGPAFQCGTLPILDAFRC